MIGWSAGENAAEFASTAKAADAEGARSQIQAHKDLIQEIRTRKIGAKWTEAYGALQQVAEDYCGSIRSEVSLEAGLDVLRRIRSRARQDLKAESAHELMYCIQALNLFDMEELLLISAGFDGHQADYMAQLNLVDADYAWVTRRLCEQADRSAGGRVVSSLEGGYELHSLARSVEAHLKAFLGEL